MHEPLLRACCDTSDVRTHSDEVALEGLVEHSGRWGGREGRLGTTGGVEPGETRQLVDEAEGSEIENLERRRGTGPCAGLYRVLHPV